MTKEEIKRNSDVYVKYVMRIMSRIQKPNDETEYIDKEGNIRCRKCHELRRKPYIINEQEIVKYAEKNNITKEEAYQYFYHPDLKNLLCWKDCSCEKKRKYEEKKRKYEEAVRKNQDKAFGNGFRKYMNCSIETDDKSNKTVSTFIKKYVENFDNMFVKGKGIIFYGNTGRGKTFAAAAILHEVCKRYNPRKGDKVLYKGYISNFSRLSQDLQSIFNSKTTTVSDWYTKINNYDLIAIDDWGRERATPFMIDLIKNITEKRYDTEKPLILTTNLDIGNKEKFLKQIMGAISFNVGYDNDAIKTEIERIYSRLCETCCMVYVDGVDRRIHNASTHFIY